MPTTLTPLRYPGGKSKYTKLFAEVISVNDLVGCTFVEVFAGGAGAAISLLLKGHVQSIILNDLDEAIYSFWKSVKECPKELIRLIQCTPISISEWKHQQSIYLCGNVRDTLSLGFAAFYLNRCNRAGILGARPVGGLRQQGTYKITSRFNKETSISKIEAIAERADCIDICNMDCLAFLKHLRKVSKRQNLLVYFDPPYYQKGPDLYLNHLNHDDHLSLCKEILRCSFPWILSYDHHKSILEMYKGRKCSLYVNTIKHTVTGNADANELIISKLKLPGFLKPVRT